MIRELQTIYGTMFLPDTDNGQFWWLETMGASPEDEMIEAVCALLDGRPRGIAVDAGANFGCWTLPLSKHATAVMAFEPQRCVFDLLKRSVLANPEITNVVPLPFALGPRPGSIAVPDLVLDETTNFGGVSLGVPHSEHPDAPTYEAKVMMLDSLVTSSDHVSFIKVDCEGAEQGIFMGARQTIRRCKPIIIAEADHPRTDRHALGELIESLGYNIEIFQDNNFIGMPL